METINVNVAHDLSNICQHFEVREESLEDLLRVGLLRTDNSTRVQAIDNKITTSVAKNKQYKRKSKLHHTQVYKVRFEPPSYNDQKPQSPKTMHSNNTFESNEYNAFARGEHKSQNQGTKEFFHQYNPDNKKLR
jgi:hypothetical protein